MGWITFHLILLGFVLPATGSNCSCGSGAPWLAGWLRGQSGVVTQGSGDAGEAVGLSSCRQLGRASQGVCVREREAGVGKSMI